MSPVNSSLKMIDKQVVFKYNSKLSSQLSKNRPTVKKTYEEAAGVYRIDCLDCDSCYIGETGRSLKTRLREHRYDVRTYKLSSGLAVHSNTEFHNFDFKNAKLLFKSNDLAKRHVIESAVINANKSKCVNLNNGNTPLNNFLSSTILDFVFKPKT